jgi:hypothetical protein
VNVAVGNSSRNQAEHTYFGVVLDPAHVEIFDVNQHYHPGIVCFDVVNVACSQDLVGLRRGEILVTWGLDFALFSMFGRMYSLKNVAPDFLFGIGTEHNLSLDE